MQGSKNIVDIKYKVKKSMELTKETFKHGRYWGMLVSIDAKNCYPEYIRSTIAIHKYVHFLCEKIDMKKFGETQIEYFGEDDAVAGFSMTQLIQTSLISGHFANKTNNAYIDIFSCKWFDPEIVKEFTQQYFKASDIKITVLLRE
jgi:S-adenosylmethionine/arginine decarboxylase-like enzyme